MNPENSIEIEHQVHVCALMARVEGAAPPDAAQKRGVGQPANKKHGLGDRSKVLYYP